MTPPAAVLVRTATSNFTHQEKPSAQTDVKTHYGIAEGSKFSPSDHSRVCKALVQTLPVGGHMKVQIFD